MYENNPTVKDGAAHEMEYHLSIEDSKSFFQHQWSHCLSETQRGCNSNLNFVSKSGELVSAHQAVILPRSSHLKFLVESSKSCGCAEDVPTILLPDWDKKTIENMISLLYSGSVLVTENSKEDVLRLMHELHLDISHQLLEEPLVHAQNNTPKDRSYEENLGWNKRIKIEEIEAGRRNEEQERVRKILGDVVDFLGRVQIKNEESLDALSKPLDDLLSALKYLPIEPSFDFLPTEIKTDILDYLCDLGAFTSASVCLDWKEIIQKRLVNKEIKIGKHCSNAQACENDTCFVPEELLRSSAIVKLDVCLKICYPVTNVDAKILAEGLTSVPELRITTFCNCGQEYAEDGRSGLEPINHMPRMWNIGMGNQRGIKEMLTQNQMDQFIETLEQRNDVLKSVELNGLDMTHLDQDKLANCLVKVERLLLGHGPDYKILNIKELLNGDVFIDKLLQRAPDAKISELYVENIDNYTRRYRNRSVQEVANALCQVQSVYLGEIGWILLEQMVKNILLLPIKMMENFFHLQKLGAPWIELISPRDLKLMMRKLKKFASHGHFSEEQLEAVRFIPEVSIISMGRFQRYCPYTNAFVDEAYDDVWILKGTNIDPTSITSFDLSELFFNK